MGERLSVSQNWFRSETLWCGRVSIITTCRVCSARIFWLDVSAPMFSALMSSYNSHPIMLSSLGSIQMFRFRYTQDGKCCHTCSMGENMHAWRSQELLAPTGLLSCLWRFGTCFKIKNSRTKLSYKYFLFNKRESSKVCSNILLHSWLVS